MIEEFADHYPGEQSRGSQSAIDDGGRNRGGTDCFTGPASVLRTDMAMDEEAGRFDIKLFADVFTDLDEILAALATGAQIRFMAMFNAQQMVGEWLTTGTHAFHRLAGAQLFNFGFLGAGVGVPAFFEQFALLCLEFGCGLFQC